MKRVLIFFAIILIPVSVFAITPLTDEDLSNISGQAGVSIMPNITMNIHIDVLAWGDSDGLGSNSIWGGQTSGGYVGATNFTISNLSIRSRTAVYNGMWPITIDVADGVARSLDESYTRVDLYTLQNPIMPLILKWR